MTAVLPGRARRLREAEHDVVAPGRGTMPRVGSATVATRRRMAALGVESVLAVRRGRRPATCVDPEVDRCRTRRRG